MKPDPHIEALADLLVGVVLREMNNPERKSGGSDSTGRNGITSNDKPKKRTPPYREGGVRHEITT